MRRLSRKSPFATPVERFLVQNQHVRRMCIGFLTKMRNCYEKVTVCDACRALLGLHVHEKGLICSDLQPNLTIKSALVLTRGAPLPPNPPPIRAPGALDPLLAREAKAFCVLSVTQTPPPLTTFVAPRVLQPPSITLEACFPESARRFGVTYPPPTKLPSH